MSTVVSEQQRTRTNNRIGGFIWFALVLAGWLSFLAAAAFDPAVIDELDERLHDLPLAAEGLAWLLLFPFVLALQVWESSWDGGARLTLILLFAAGWSLAFYPWRRKGRSDPAEAS